MRVIIALLICFFLQLDVGAHAQKITIAEKNIPLEKVFSIIQKQSGLSLLYDSRLIKNQKNIDVQMNAATVEAVLDYCLKDLPFTYVITDKIIVIKETPKAEPREELYAINGLVRGKDSLPLANVSVMIKELRRGIQTNTNGEFTLAHLPAGSYNFTFSYIGYEALVKKVTITANACIGDIHLQKADSKLEEITVTALGLTRKTRSLTYATQKIDGDEFSSVKSTNVLNSLNGKVAGVQVNRTSGGAGGSVRIVLRGDKSTRNSQPLYVIDGLPIMNPVGGPDAGLYNNAPDAGDILSNINPDDIESVSVLKGAGASALYGSQGGNGVILITTKKGKTGATKIDLSSSITFDRAYGLPAQQFDYMQSTPPDATNPGSDDSWGPKGATQPAHDYVKDFFQTGITLINSISLSTGTEKSANYLSYSNTDNKGILPTSTFKQNTLSFRQNSKLLNDKLIFDATFLGSIQNIHNRMTPGVYFNPLTGLYLFPRGLDFNQYKNFEYFSNSRYLYAQNWWNINYDKDQASGGGWGGQDYQQNPYWILNRNPVDNRNQNVYVSASLKYILNKWLVLQGRGNINNLISDYQRNIYATTQATISRFNGGMNNARSSNTTVYGDVLLTGTTKLSNDWELHFTTGVSIQNQVGKMLSISGSPTVPNVFLESALDRSTIDIQNFNVKSNGPGRKQTQSIFGNAQIGYKNRLFLDLADRNDWSSTLAFTPSEKKGFNYFEAGVSAVLNELFRLPPAINYLQLRTSYAIVGNDIAPFSSFPLYTFAQGGMAMPPGSSPVTVVPGLGLKPEKNKSIEVGLKLTAFQNKLSFDFTWYQSSIVNQYFKGVAVPPGLGTGGFADINSGNIQNKGIEIAASFKVIDSRTFQWTTSLNFSRNKNTIITLFNPAIVANTSPDQVYRLQGGTGGYDGVLKQGGSYGDIYGKALSRDAQGRIIVRSTTGLPELEDDHFLGNPNPRFIAGWKNSFSIRNCTISWLIDGKFGGKVLSVTSGYFDQLGVSKQTGDVRDAGGLIYISNAVDENGQPWKNATDAKAYYKLIGGKTPVENEYMYDATAIRLREIVVAYRIPLQYKWVKDFKVGLIGSNLFFFRKHAPFDPEQVAGVNPGGVGVDVFGLPSYRSIGISVNCTF